jgi:hypothetical protein
MTLEEAGITPEHIVYMLLQEGKITIQTAIKFHLKELTLKQVLETIT